MAQKNIKKYKWSNITQYLVLEGLDSIWKVTLLADVEISTLDEPPNVVWLWVGHCRQLQLLDNLY